MILMEDMLELKETKEWKETVKLNRLWKNDPLFNEYHALSTKVMGKVGEIFVSHYMKKNNNSKVKEPLTMGHDRIIDDHKTEIKFSLATANSKKTQVNRDKFVINHVAKGKDWERLIFCGINPENGNGEERIRIHWMGKKDFVNYMNSPGKKVFKHQQSGKKVKNDDYICTDYEGLVKLSFVKGIAEW